MNTYLLVLTSLCRGNIVPAIDYLTSEMDAEEVLEAARIAAYEDCQTILHRLLVNNPSLDDSMSDLMEAAIDGAASSIVTYLINRGYVPTAWDVALVCRNEVSPEFPVLADMVYACGEADYSLAIEHVINQLHPREHLMRLVEKHIPIEEREVFLARAREFSPMLYGEEG